MTATCTADSSAGRVKSVSNQKHRFAAVPREYERFIRLYARTFLPARAVVLVDQLVRLRYCTEFQLLPILRANQKQCRSLLWQLRDRGMVRCEPRVYKRVFPGRRPGAAPFVRQRRLLYWYVDYQNVLNNALYRVHRVQEILEERLRENASGATDSNGAVGNYVCERCNRTYTALDVPALLQESTGELRCTQLVQRGVRCAGTVREVDRSQELAALRQLRHAVEVELRPLVDAAAACLVVEAPKHPLDDMDEDQVGAFIAAHQPERPRREEAALTESERAADSFLGSHELDIEVEVTGLVENGSSAKDMEHVTGVQAKDRQGQPEQPAWFGNASSRTTEHTGLKSSAEHSGPAPGRLEPGTLTTSSNAAEQSASADAEAFEDDYADVDFEEAVDSGADGTWYDNLDKEDTYQPAWSPAPEADLEIADDSEAAPSSEALWHTSEAPDEAGDSFATSDADATAVCLVGGERIPLQDITAAHTARMSVSEYQRYYELLQQRQRFLVRALHRSEPES